jgi:plastocyanin
MMRALVVTFAAVALLPIAGARASFFAASDRGMAVVNLRGKVDVRHPLDAPAPRPGVSDLGKDQLFRPDDRRRAVVYFESGPQPAFEETADLHATMKQEGETFVPHVLAIRAGTVVDFPNFDPVFHNVFSLSKPRSFDLGRYAKGRSKAVRFGDPGVVRVFCDIHSHMNAFILVFAHRFFAVTDDQGRYTIDRVPAGTYTVTAWYEGVAQQSRQLVVPEDGAAIDLDFALR